MTRLFAKSQYISELILVNNRKIRFLYHVSPGGRNGTASSLKNNIKFAVCAALFRCFEALLRPNPLSHNAMSYVMR